MDKESTYTTFAGTKKHFSDYLAGLIALALPVLFLTANAAIAGEEADGERPTVLFFGDSLTAGYDVNPDDAYPAVIERMLRENGYPHRVVNAGLSGETTAGGLRRVDWILRRKVDVFVLALGGNDALRGLNPAETGKNLGQILEKVRDRYPDAKLLLAGMKAPANMGDDYGEAFAAVYPELAAAFEIPLVPFLLEGMAADPDYNLDDLIHPNERGHRVIAENIWVELEPLLKR